MSLTLIRSGSLLLPAGLIFGLAIHSTPYPRLALAAHVQMTSQGVLTIVAGLLLDRLRLGRGMAMTVVLGHLAIWPQCGSEVVAAYYGAADALKLAAAGIPRGPDAVEKVITLLHVIPGLLLLAAWAVLSWGVCTQGLGMKQKKV